MTANVTAEIGTEFRFRDENRVKAMRVYTAISKSSNGSATRSASSILLTPELIEEYLCTLGGASRSPSTLAIYRAKLNKLYDYLPEDKHIRPDTLECRRDSLLTESFWNRSS